jgi:hypothetical protein
MAQTASTGALTGAITDNSGAFIPDVKITVTNEATGEVRTVVTQPNGNYLVPLLLPGSYRVELSKAGFKQAVKAGLQVNVTETSRLDVPLEVGAVEEQVTITTETLLVQTESTALGRVTDQVLVSNLPLVTRNYTLLRPDQLNVSSVATERFTNVRLSVPPADRWPRTVMLLGPLASVLAPINMLSRLNDDGPDIVMMLFSMNPNQSVASPGKSATAAESAADDPFVGVR